MDVLRPDPATLARHADWWQGKGLLRADVRHEPLGDLVLPLADGSVASADMEVLPENLDLDRLATQALDPVDAYLEGDALRVVQPFVRVPWVEAILGCPVSATIAGGSMRTKAFVASWKDWRDRKGERAAEWRATLLSLTERLVDCVASSRAVAPTLMRGPADLAEAVLGPELMCLSMYDHPAELRSFVDEATDVFIDTLHMQLAIIPRIDGGYVNQFGIWAPGTVVRTQCDASAFLSATHYTQWYLPSDIRICEAFDYSIIHLHSVSLHTVEALLRADVPHAIQVTIETTQNAPSIDQMVPLFRRILSRKSLVVDGPLAPNDVATLHDRLPQDGLCIINRSDGW